MEIRLSNDVSILTNVHTRSTLSINELERKNRENKIKRQAELEARKNRENRIQTLLSVLCNNTYCSQIMF